MPGLASSGSSVLTGSPPLADEAIGAHGDEPADRRLDVLGARRIGRQQKQRRRRRASVGRGQARPSRRKFQQGTNAISLSSPCAAGRPSRSRAPRPRWRASPGSRRCCRPSGSPTPGRPAAAVPRCTKPPTQPSSIEMKPAGPDQVLLLQPPPVHLGRIVLEAEVGPDQVHLADAARHDLAHRQAVVDLLQDEAGEDRQDLQLDVVAELLDRIEHAGIGQREVGRPGRCGSAAPCRRVALAPSGMAMV